MEPKSTSTPTKKPPTKKGYGKRPMWQWVVIYLIVAVVVYAVVYFVFIRKTGTSTGGGY